MPRRPSGSQPRDPHPAPAPQSRGGFRGAPLVGVLLLFAVNHWTGSRTMKQPSRARVPYSPFFVQQIKAGNVESITSTGTAIQGGCSAEESTRRRAAARLHDRDPVLCGHEAARPLLEAQQGGRQRGAAQRQAPLWERFVVGFVPTILFCCFSSGFSAATAARRMARRARPLAGAALRTDPTTPITFAEVAGIDEAKAELTEIVDFLKNPERYHRLGGRIPRGVLLSGSPGPARRCSRGRSPARRTCRSSRSPRRSSSRLLLASAPPACATSSRRRKRPRRRSCSSTSSTRSAGRAAQARRLQRRERGARADAEPDPDRDGRVRLVDRSDRDRRDQPPGRPRQGAAPARTIRPPHRRQPPDRAGAV